MPAKLSAQCAFGMFIAILMTGIFPEARAEPVVIEIARAGPVLLKPPASPGGRIEIAQVGSGEPRGDTVGRRDRPGVVAPSYTRGDNQDNHGLSAASPPRKEGKDGDRRRPQPHRRCG